MLSDFFPSLPFRLYFCFLSPSLFHFYLFSHLFYTFLVLRFSFLFFCFFLLDALFCGDTSGVGGSCRGFFSFSLLIMAEYVYTVRGETLALTQYSVISLFGRNGVGRCRSLDGTIRHTCNKCSFCFVGSSATFLSCLSFL